MEVKCPTCGKTVVWEESPARPFCSERCQLIDFGGWVDEEYRVPVEDHTSEIDLDVSDGEDGDANSLR